MPTGYTCDVVNGKCTDFPTFLMRCARAFLPDCRDSSLDSPIPDEPSGDDSYYEKAVVAAQEKLQGLLAMTDEEKGKLVRKMDAEAIEFAQRGIAEARLKRQRLEEMEKAVEKWRPPSDKHRDLKKFMLEQLQQTINFDSSTDYYEAILNNKREASAEEVWQREVLYASTSVQRREEDLANVKRRREEGRLWIRQLKESVAAL